MVNVEGHQKYRRRKKPNVDEHIFIHILLFLYIYLSLIYITLIYLNHFRIDTLIYAFVENLRYITLIGGSSVG